jgi:hypothetical protein
MAVVVRAGRRRSLGRRDVLRQYLDAAVLEVTALNAGQAIHAHDASTPGTPAARLVTRWSGLGPLALLVS